MPTLSQNTPRMASAFVLVAVLAACAQTSEVPQSALPLASGFIDDYSRLQPNAARPGSLIYVKRPGVLSGYDKLMIDPVTVWISSDAEYGGVDPERLAVLSNYFHDAFVKAVAPNYQVVDRPGPGVLRVRAALTRIRPVRPPAPTIGAHTGATFVQAKLLASASSESPLYEATMEAELLDAVTNERLAAVVERRKGDRVTDALDHWALRLRVALDTDHQLSP